MAIEIEDFPIKNGGSFQFAILNYQRVTVNIAMSSRDSSEKVLKKSIQGAGHEFSASVLGFFKTSSCLGGPPKRMTFALEPRQQYRGHIVRTWSTNMCQTFNMGHQWAYKIAHV